MLRSNYVGLIHVVEVVHQVSVTSVVCVIDVVHMVGPSELVLIRYGLCCSCSQSMWSMQKCDPCILYVVYVIDVVHEVYVTDMIYGPCGQYGSCTP